jgi:hypothetical protein
MSRALAEQCRKRDHAAAARAMAGRGRRAATERAAQEHFRNVFDILQLQRQPTGVLARAATVDNACHGRLGVDPMAGMRDLERDDEALPSEGWIGGANHQARGGKVDDAIGYQLEITLSYHLAVEANGVAGRAAADFEG